MLSIFFILVVHIFALPYGIDYFFILLVTLGLIGFSIIYRITNSLTYLSSRIKLITTKNLTEKVTGIRSQDEIEELATSFNNLLDRMHLAFEREQQFIADIAHEMKTPLAIMRSSLEVSLSKERSKEDYKKVIEEAILETNQLSLTLKNVLDLAWSESPNEKIKMIPIKLSDLLEELCDIAEKMALRKQIIIHTSITKHLAVLGFKEKLAQALINIIENAIKYTPMKSSITISLQKDQENAVIVISDTGRGIAEEDMPHIFDRFYRGKKTEKVLGSGLGLAISKSIVTLHHGYITFDSTIGKGSTCTITLPVI